SLPNAHVTDPFSARETSLGPPGGTRLGTGNAMHPVRERPPAATPVTVAGSIKTRTDRRHSLQVTTRFGPGSSSRTSHTFGFVARQQPPRTCLPSSKMNILTLDRQSTARAASRSSLPDHPAHSSGTGSDPGVVGEQGGPPVRLPRLN